MALTCWTANVLRHQQHSQGNEVPIKIIPLWPPVLGEWRLFRCVLLIQD